MKRIFSLFAFLLYWNFAFFVAADISENTELLDAVQKYYETVDKAKSSYENELRKTLESTQKAGNLQAYNAIEAELKHTTGKEGHSITNFEPPRNSSLYSKKVALKRTVETARNDFKKIATKISSEILADGKVEESRDINRIANSVEPPRSYLETLKRLENKKETERPLVVRKQFLNIPEAKLKTKLSSRPGSWSSFGKFTPDSKKFVAVSRGEGGSNVFDVESGKVIAKVDYPRYMNRIDIHPNGKIVASGSEGGKIILWNIDDGSVIREIPAHAENSFIDGIRFSSDGSFVASGASDRTAAVWNTETGKELMRFKGHTDIILAVDISPDEKLLATSSQDGSVRLWNIATGKESYCVKEHTKNDIHALSFNHKGTVLASGSSDDTIVFLDVRTGKTTKRLEGFEGEILDISFSPNDSQLLVGCEYSFHSSVWDVETGLPLYRLPSPERGTRTATFSPDGKMIATCSIDPIVIWNVPTRNELIQWERELKRKRETVKEIPLIEMPLEHAEVGWTRWNFMASKTDNTSDKYIYAHAPSKYVFLLDGKWKTFNTNYGTAKWSDLRRTNCIFIVKGDGKELFRSEEVKDSSVRSLELDVSNINSLELTIDPNGVNAGDHGCWYTPILKR